MTLKETQPVRNRWQIQPRPLVSTREGEMAQSKQQAPPQLQVPTEVLLEPHQPCKSHSTMPLPKSKQIQTPASARIDTLPPGEARKKLSATPKKSMSKSLLACSSERSTPRKR